MSKGKFQNASIENGRWSGMDDDTVIVADFDIVKRKRMAREAILMLFIKTVENPTMTKDHVIDEIDSILDTL